jgi:M3 family oligoendopeptidase
MPTDFHDLQAPTPTLEATAARYETLFAAWDAADSPSACRQVIDRWDQLVRELATWENLTELRFNQDTSNSEYKQAREYADELHPKLVDLAVRLKRKLIASPHRGELQNQLGTQAFALWEADVMAFDPKIQDDMVAEAKLQAEYTDLLASALLEFQGQSLNFSALERHFSDANRQVRHDAQVVRWSWYAQHSEQLDRIYHEQVQLRDGMARQLGFDNYVGLAYKQMKRVDYDRQDIERFRAEVRQHVVPLGQELRRRQAKSLGIDRVMMWDDAVQDPQGNPKPRGDHDWLVARAQEMFDAMGGGLGEFFRLMVGCHLMDLKNRDGKAGGGFCTDFPSEGLPFVFANFNGTQGDVEVFTHEIGHAFQSYSSRQQPLADYLFPTYESCEIHSMGLEFLTWPQMHRFFAEDADRFRRIHLTQSLLFLPYGVAVDHFQHLVYERPEATPADRHAMWQEMEQLYLPWRNTGDLPHVGEGGQWQSQRHIYLYPFYYIDYTLALTCALQFWVRSRQDMESTMATYVKLCQRGGEAPFQELARSAGLISPFDDGCLKDVVEQARIELGVE